MFTEVTERRGFDAIQPVAEVHLVQVQLQDVALAELTLDACRDDDFLQLASIGLLRRQKTLSGQLLGERASALHGAALAEIRQRGAGNANDIEAAVVEEPLILDGGNRLDDVRRDAFEWHLDP